MPVKTQRFASLALPACFAALALGGCKQAGRDANPAPSVAASEPANGLSISDARLVLPAVKGNPGAAYFTVGNASTGTKAIVGVAIDGVGKAEAHQTMSNEMTQVDRVDIAPGTHIAFEPGKLHVMAFDPAQSLTAGAKTKLTVTFATGETATADMAIQSAGEATMDDMDHGSSH